MSQLTDRVVRKLADRLGRDPRDDEVANELLGVLIERVMDVQSVITKQHTEMHHFLKTQHQELMRELKSG